MELDAADEDDDELAFADDDAVAALRLEPKDVVAAESVLLFDAALVPEDWPEPEFVDDELADAAAPPPELLLLVPILLEEVGEHATARASMGAARRSFKLATI